MYFNVYLNSKIYVLQLCFT